MNPSMIGTVDAAPGCQSSRTQHLLWTDSVFRREGYERTTEQRKLLIIRLNVFSTHTEDDAEGNPELKLPRNLSPTRHIQKGG